MSWISNLYKQTETAVTKKVVALKLKGIIGSLKKRNDSEILTIGTITGQIEESTAVIGDMVDDAFKLFAHMYKGVNSKLVESISDNEEAIVNLVSNNADAFLLIARAVKKLDTDINKQSAMSIVGSVKEDVVDYLNGPCVKEIDKHTDGKLSGDVASLRTLWDLDMKYYLMDISGDKTTEFQVSKEDYETYQTNYVAQHGKWDESKTSLKTRQTSCIHPNKQTTEEFYASLGINYSAIIGNQNA